MSKDALYVEIDGYAAKWLESLISRGLIAGGDVTTQSVVHIVPRDLERYRQVHLYAGIGVWSYSLRRAGISDQANVWTFSEPCQPFSDAGKGLGFADDRYLRPYTNHLIEQCRPSICLGEQVASNDGLGWLDVVQTDMERAGYACGALDTCSAGVGAPHIRQRLRVCAVAEEWLADTNGKLHDGSATGGMVHAERARLEGLRGHGNDRDQPGRLDTIENGSIAAPGGACGLAGIGHNQWPGPTNGHWSDADWLRCRNGFWRPVEPGTFPLADGAPSRVGRLRAYGNAVDAEATTAFCRATGELLGLI